MEIGEFETHFYRGRWGERWEVMILCIPDGYKININDEPAILVQGHDIEMARSIMRAVIYKRNPVHAPPLLRQYRTSNDPPTRDGDSTSESEA